LAFVMEGVRARVILVHHGDAVPAGVDPMRPLSSRGRADVEGLAQAAATRGAKPRAVWHSGKLRARQTAEACWRACNPLAEFSAIRGLQPDDPPDWVADRLLAEDGEVMLVGHMPHLSRLLQRLVPGREGEAAAGFPLNGAVCLEDVAGRWEERWRLAPGG
jgi:phosphohistidine phosphatase